MKARNAAVQGALAVVGLVAAFLTWQRPPERTTGDKGFVVLDATKQSLERVRYEDGTRYVELTREVVGEPVFWVTQGHLGPKLPAPSDSGIEVVALDGGADGGALLVSVKQPEPPPTRRVRGSEVAANVHARFAPLEATRALGVQSAEKLKELGLDAPERKLEVLVAGTLRSFTVSKPMPGVFGTYLLDAKTNQVFLLQGSLFSDFEPSSQALVERRLHSFRMSEVDRFLVTAAGQTVDFVVTDPTTPQNLRVARAATPAAPDELMKNWYEKTWNRMVVTEVLGQGEEPKGGAPQVELRIEYFARDRSKGWLELAINGARAFWARSENTAGWVAVHQGAEELTLEAKKVILEPK
jgi:hypothetical protein